jgi:uncharacterized C2H2 Zn-finger protein
MESTWPRPCPDCGVTVNSDRSYSRHKQTDHPEKSRKYKKARDMTDEEHKEHIATLRRETNKRYRSKGKDDKVSVLLC